MQRILILKSDLLRADALRVIAGRSFPRAALVVASTLAQAEAALAARPVNLLLTGLDLTDGDALDFIFTYVKSLRRVDRVLVVTEHHEQWVLEMLRAWRVDGVFDPLTEDTPALELALRSVAAGQPYWSQRLRERLAASVAGGCALGSVLTAAELALIATIGDGTDDTIAAERLGVTLATIQTMRRNLHQKLGLHDRGDLIRFAVQHGFVRFSRGNIVRPAFEHAHAAYTARRPREKRAPQPRRASSKAA